MNTDKEFEIGSLSEDDWNNMIQDAIGQGLLETTPPTLTVPEPSRLSRTYTSYSGVDIRA